jgi:hypothetical protein
MLSGVPALVLRFCLPLVEITTSLRFLPTFTSTTRLITITLGSVIFPSLATESNEVSHTLVRNWLHLSHALLIRRRTGVVWFIMLSFS